MIVNERITAYINSLDRGNGSLCDEVEEEAVSSYVPIIRKETSALLKTLVAMKRPERILEVGTAVGYSALLMSRVITLLEGDAEEILGSLSGPYDFIFMDAAKGQYLHWLPVMLRLLPKGGVLVSDNVLQDGDIIESRYAVERRNRTIHARMREYLYTLTHMEEFETSIIPIGDGVTISVKK